MVQQVATTLLRGGLNLVSPPLSVPPGMATAAVNYEPDVSGYKRIGGYERFDGGTAPSAGGTRGDIDEVPGTGNVLGVWTYDGSVWAFRRSASTSNTDMYKSTALGWELQTFGHTLDFTAGTAAFVEGETVTGATSSADAVIKRLVLQSGSWADGDAAGYLVVDVIVASGTFQAAETITSASGSATNTAAQAAITITTGANDVFSFVNSNFYGNAVQERMYFSTNRPAGPPEPGGPQILKPAFEWDGTTLAPILPSNTTPIGNIGAFRNHLVLGVGSSLMISGIGEPLDFRAIAGASEIAVGDLITNFAPSLATAFVVLGQKSIGYLAGNDSSDFQLLPISSNAGAYAFTATPFGESPVYLDAAGIRKISTSAAFGDFTAGTLSQLVEPLFRKKREDGVKPAASLVIRGRDQYWLFFDDQTGVILYLGRKDPECLPFILPIEVTCACAGELLEGQGERHFVGAADGFVYELNKGTSFDGAEVQAYIRFGWANIGAPHVDKRFHSVEFGIDTPSACEIGVAFHVDYAIPGNPGGARQDIDVAQGSQSLIPLDDYDDITWSQPVLGQMRAYLSGIGRNCAITLVSEHTTEEPHTLQSMALNFSPRKMAR